MVNLFAGYDKRESIGFHVFMHSVIERASVPVNITALASQGMPQGSNSFTLSRFLVPYLCGFKGHAIFADASDMVMLGDIAELDALYDDRYAVQVVKRPDYVSQHRFKYVGTPMACQQSNYPKKNWASLMIINCEHPAWSLMRPMAVADMHSMYLLQLQFCREKDIGELPPEWNALVDEGDAPGKLLHWTAGIPAFPHYQDAPCAEIWINEAVEMLKV